jgi:MFS family permease
MPPLHRNRDFVLLGVGQGVSRLGDGLYAAAVVWTAWELTLTPGQVGLVALAAGLPTFLAGLVGSSYADRYDRRRLMIGSDAARALLLVPIPLLLHAGDLNAGGLAVLAALVGMAGGPFAPARNALVPAVVGEQSLLQANALLQVSFRSAYFVGPLLFAPAQALVGLSGVFIVDIATFACSALTLVLMRLRQTRPDEERMGLVADLLGGLRALRAAPEVALVIATFTLAILAASGFLTVGVATLVGTKLDAGGGAYGLLLGVAGIAEIVGALVLARIRLPNLARTAVLAWALLGVFRLPLGLVTSVTAAAALLAATGFASAITDIPVIALVQQRIPDRHLAKALGLWEAGIGAGLALAPPLAGFILDRAGLEWGFAISGALLIGIGGLATVALARIDRPVDTRSQVR